MRPAIGMFGILGLRTPMRRPNKRPDTMTKSTTIVVALALILGALTIAAVGIIYKSPANASALPFAVTPGIETPVHATKSDRLNVRPDIRKIAGVTVVLRDFDSIIR